MKCLWRQPHGVADEIWEQCNALLAQDAFSARGIMKQMNVKMVGTKWATQL
jgi:glucuronate isomerase